MPLLAHAPTAAVGVLVCVGDSVAGAVRDGSSFGQRSWISPQVWWRNSAPGVDLLAYFAPNPLHPLFGSLSFGWLSALPGGFNENVASVPWVALVTIVGAVLWAGFRPLKGWVVFTGLFAWLALGPFITVAQQLTYIPTPWALLRYLPIIGAARTPTRLTILVMLGVVDAAGDGGAAPAQPVAPSAPARGRPSALCCSSSCCPRRGRCTRPRSPRSIGSSPPIRGRSASCRCRSDCVTA